MHFFRPLSLSVVALLAFSTMARADTIGNSPVAGSSVDSCPNCDYILNQTFAAAGETVTGYSFYAYQAGNLTPVLFTEQTVAGNAIFTVVGVGTAQTVAAAGPQTFSFGLTSGTAVTDAATYFGFYSTAPTVAFSYDSGTPNNFFSNPGYETVNDSFNAGQTAVVMQDSLNGVNNREYSIDATATVIAATPEPSSLSLMGLGLAGVSALLRRRRSA